MERFREDHKRGDMNNNRSVKLYYIFHENQFTPSVKIEILCNTIPFITPYIVGLEKSSSALLRVSSSTPFTLYASLSALM